MYAEKVAEPVNISKSLHRYLFSKRTVDMDSSLAMESIKYLILTQKKIEKECKEKRKPMNWNSNSLVFTEPSKGIKAKKYPLNAQNKKKIVS